MKSFKQFIQDANLIFEMLGDFGSPAPKIKPNCYGRFVKYKMLPKRHNICAFKRKR